MVEAEFERKGMRELVRIAEPVGEVETFQDGSVKFLPAFTKLEARFIRNAKERFGAVKVCDDCSHFIKGGACHVVQGEINPNDKCFEFFADVGAFADNEGGMDVSLVLWGEIFDWSEKDVDAFLETMRNKIIDRIERERRGR